MKNLEDYLEVQLPYPWSYKSHIKSKRFPFNTFKILWHPLTEKARIGSFYHHYIVNGILSVIKHKGPYELSSWKIVSNVYNMIMRCSH